MSAISVENLCKSYEDLHVVDGLSFTVEEGAVFGLLGPNGAGKTTTIDMLTGVTAADSGSITVLGEQPTDEPTAVREQVGILPEKEAPPSFLTPREYFLFIGDMREMDPAVVTERVSEWAARLDFEETLSTLCKDLSRGQQQKVMLTQALLHEPELVFIDEPLANLDPLMQERVKQFIAEYNEQGHTIVLSTHHVEVAQALCTQVSILEDGAFIEQLDPRELAEGRSVRDTYLEAVDESALSEVSE